ncbi:MAG: GTP cyclohydrolase I, partial [Candidatus Limnocylindrus sp.]
MKKETARAVQARDASAAHGAIEAATIELIRAIGEDPTRDGLRETPARVARSYVEMTAGYEMDPREILGTVFE